ncbi:MAG TPA: UbiA family prenyltransferase [Streptosporangiaceae bacterium]|nr:UbiA family prenyltransferase [Streptosporangiaceae bacterium]
MSRRIRLVVLLARPAVMLLLAMFAATGLAAAGRGQDTAALARALVTVIGFLLFSVACNDLADEAIDRVNLPGRRPLTNGTGTRREMAIAGGTGAVMALAASVTLHWPAIVVSVAGLAVSAGYSLRPVRLADRGLVASLVLPACYVAVPYLTGVFAAGASVTPRELLLLAGLYLGFTGRILLKDFRDVRGDALFGKRTLLVRHGRGWTCVISAGCWAAGTGVMLAAAPGPATGLAVAEGACLLLVLALLADLSRSRSARRDEFRISALAIAGRGMILLLLAHLSMTGAGWLAPTGSGYGVLYPVVLVLLAAATIGMAASMAAYGPACRLTVPDWEPATPAREPATSGGQREQALADCGQARSLG